MKKENNCYIQMTLIKKGNNIEDSAGMVVFDLKKLGWNDDEILDSRIRFINFTDDWDLQELDIYNDA